MRLQKVWRCGGSHRAPLIQNHLPLLSRRLRRDDRDRLFRDFEEAFRGWLGDQLLNAVKKRQTESTFLFDERDLVRFAQRRDSLPNTVGLSKRTDPSVRSCARAVHLGLLARTVEAPGPEEKSERRHPRCRRSL